MTKNTFLKRIMFLICCMLIACSIFSCKGIEITGKTENIDGYTEQQAMAIIASERNRIQSVFGPEIWSIAIEGQQQKTYGAYFVASMKDFLQDIKTLNILAKEKGIIATSTEMKSIRDISEQFYNGLTDEDKDLMGNCTLKDVTDIYTEYFIASKTAEYLLSNVDSEVPDADAKVIEVQKIVVSDKAAAENLLSLVNVKGANFAYYARQNSEDPDDTMTLAKNEKENAVYQAAFDLEKDEISGVIEQDGKYYILKCTNAYDQTATNERKAKLEQSIRSNAFKKSYQEYADQHIVRFREGFWKDIDLTKDQGSTANNFFALYDENIKTS